MRYILVSFCLSICFLSACKKEPIIVSPPEPQIVDLTLRFRTTYGGAHLIKNKDYAYDDFKVQFSHFSTFLTNITLLKGSEEVPLSEAEWLNFTPSASTNDSSVVLTYTWKVLEADYTGLKIGYGVSPKLNTKPADYPTDHALNNESEFWPGWKSYIFNRIEGQGDGDNNGEPDLFLLYHCGGNAVFRTFEFNTPVKVAGNSRVEIEFDLKNLFWSNNQWFDMRGPKNSATSNSANDVRVATILMDQWDEATKITQ